MDPIPRAQQDLPAILESLVERHEPGARLLAAGWASGAVRERLERPGDLWLEDLSLEDLWLEAVPGDLDRALPDGESFATVLWRVGEGRTVPAAALRERLCDGGRLIVAAPAEEAAPSRAGRRRGGLASAGQPILRGVLRTLSEAGFRLGRERRVADPSGEWAVIAARKDPFAIRSYRSGDEGAILELFPTCFHVERGLDHWRWKYLGNPYGALKISMAFAPGGALAAHYASYPMPFWIGDPARGRDLLALQMGDTMTSPRFREEGRGRNGLLPRTVRHFFSIYRDGTYAFYYGFNTGPIQRFCQWFIGGGLVAPVGYWTKDLDGGLPVPGRERYRVRHVRRTDAEWDRFFVRAAPHYGFLVRRDARWVSWRYLSCPDTEFVLLAASRWGRLAGWSVFRRQEDLLVWGDALFDPRHPGAAAAILAEALRHPVLAGARRLVAWFPEQPRWWSERLPALGLRSAPEPDGLGMVALEDGEPDALEKLAGLYYTMGDGDLF